MENVIIQEIFEFSPAASSSSCSSPHLTFEEQMPDLQFWQSILNTSGSGSFGAVLWTKRWLFVLIFGIRANSPCQSHAIAVYFLLLAKMLTAGKHKCWFLRMYIFDLWKQSLCILFQQEPGVQQGLTSYNILLLCAAPARATRLFPPSPLLGLTSKVGVHI